MIIYVCEQLVIPDEGDNETSMYWEPVKAVYTKKDGESFVKDNEEHTRNYYPLELK